MPVMEESGGDRCWSGRMAFALGFNILVGCDIKIFHKSSCSPSLLARRGIITNACSFESGEGVKNSNN